MPGEGSPCARSQEAQGAHGWNSQHRALTDGEGSCTPLRAGSSVPKALGTRGWLEAVSQQLRFSQPTAGAPPLVAAGTNGWDSRSSAVLGRGGALGECCRDRTQPAATLRALPEVTARLGSSHKLKPNWEQLQPLTYTLSPHCSYTLSHVPTMLRITRALSGWVWRSPSPCWVSCWLFPTLSTPVHTSLHTCVP